MSRQQQGLDTVILPAQLSGYSDGKCKNFCSVLNQYLRFCNEFQFSPFSASVKALNGFAIITCLRAKSLRTVTNYLSRLKTLHHLFDLPTKNFSDFGVRLTTIRGLNKTMLHVSQRKRPITIDMLHSFANILLSGDHINNVSILACILTGFFSFFRSSNILPKSQSQFHSLRQLSRASFRFCPWGVVLSVFHTKNRQFPDKPLCTPIPKIKNSVICPVRTLQQHFKQFPAPTSCPAFLVRENSRIRSLSVAELRTVHWYQFYISIHVIIPLIVYAEEEQLLPSHLVYHRN